MSLAGVLEEALARIGGVVASFTQGALQLTGRQTDLAIQFIRDAQKFFRLLRQRPPTIGG